MNEITQKGGLKGNYTNHSGKRSCVKLYNSGVPEQEIRTQTGHPSETAIRKYNTPFLIFLMNINQIIQNEAQSVNY